MVLCVVVFSLQSNCFVTVLHVVSHCCPGYCNACQFLCMLSLLLLVPSFVDLGMALCSIASCFFYKCYRWRRVCRSHFRILVLVVSIFVFGVVGAVVVVSLLLLLSIVCVHLLVTGTVFLNQIQVCYVGS